MDGSGHRRRGNTARAAARGLLVGPRAWRLLCALAAVASVTLAVVGQWRMDRAAAVTGSFGSHFLDLLYGALGLFVFQPPAVPDTALSVPLQVARFLAPAATLYALADVLVLPTARLRARLASGHVVVCGSGPGALALVAKLRAARVRVVLVAEHGRADLVDLVGGDGVTVLVGDPASEALLRSAGVGRAQRLYVTGPATGHNGAVVTAAQTVARAAGRAGTDPLRCLVEESDPDVLDAMWMLLLRRPASDPVTIEFYNPARLGARLLLDEVQPRWDPVGDEPVVVAGLSTFGRELVVEIARRRHRALGHGAGRLAVVVVDEQAATLVERLCRRYSVVEDMLDIACEESEVDALGLDQLVHPSHPGVFVTQIFVCYADAELALRKALATSRPPTRRSVVVRVDRMSPLGEALRPGSTERQGPMAALYDDLDFFPERERACDPDDAPDDRLEAWAEAIHVDYCRQRLESGEVRDDNEALVAWENLPEKYRSNNYDQARDIETKLRLIGCASARMAAAPEAFAFTADEVERLSRWEHERWMRNRVAHGWSFGEVRDNDRLLHPDIRPYDELSTETKEKDAQMVRLIPDLLAGAGYRVVRFPTPAAAG
ncbi:NAD-binding protein [Frankia sp. AgB1.9]|uniref:RyR domain-containing protein n=1 Tax=unclassified Frankia TaxID=2632575 RepID=UPI0019314075|nr:MULTISPECIES: RyR domain-containing protein [unclassified Frankia]MBL7494099.1 NAD-binding protein [Frankia sp. AgW1.1]MBL7553277.1 NAD-binding protein [Frankia sp. AgB1.9]MBL7625299.1 NAD-binding protein [Frankia sp. AgB1.8]